jgi:outer membrane protein TolC
MQAVRSAVACASVLFSAHVALAQMPPQPTESVTFAQAIERAVARNPSAAVAAAGILRAQALLASARADERLQVNGNVAVTTLNRSVQFEDTTVTPSNSLLGTIDIRMPLYAPATWARRAEAEEATGVATLSGAETRRQTALATADAYLTILARRKVLESNVRSRDTSRAHFDLASQLEERGTGSRLNRLRAQQVVSSNETFIEAAQFAVYRAQEALGVLLVADGPVDAADEPNFAPSADSAAAEIGRLRSTRADLKLFDAEVTAAEHTLANASKSRLPLVQGIFQPQATYPAQFFTPQATWRLLFQVDVPIFDSGTRSADRTLRQSALDLAKATQAGAITNASSEVRTAREAVASAQRTLASARAAAAQAGEVVNIVNVSFRAGGATNIEVIDAERTARDTDTVVAVAEDAQRRAQLDLLIALGQFP